jgi:hypothetical protein
MALGSFKLEFAVCWELAETPPGPHPTSSVRYAQTPGDNLDVRDKARLSTTIGSRARPLIHVVRQASEMLRITRRYR